MPHKFLFTIELDDADVAVFRDYVQNVMYGGQPVSDQLFASALEGIARHRIATHAEALRTDGHGLKRDGSRHGG